ncbi:PREDICTED: uncharacterized protein LOC109206620 [Nicotiana attenuata]|uniref:uncharacterized protein LOC109206620 n=1 Tax=Nicotiana attenuata TaxID=49451 RepID=UPI000905AA45|nr:PREDICTED: uncharacterized protein LOC109206620 [Nicotiana attenuata]
MADAAVEFYRRQFSNKGDTSDLSLLDHAPTMVTLEQNMELSRMPTFEEVKGDVFELSGESASGPDGFTGLFYQTCWDIVGRDIHNMVMHFYGGATLPKSITHTNLVLLPKKLRVETFSDLRPISLSNFTNKVLSRVLHDRLEKFLPLLISHNQSGFVKGRSIFENILLTQEIVTDASGFFKSTRGVKQGDPLSPGLFILSAEVLSRSLNKLFDDRSFVGFGMPKWSDPLNHLAYADDTIIFSSAHPPSLSKIMEVLGDYEKVSGQMINKAKSSYYMHAKVAHGLVKAVGDITGFTRGKFPFTYLGCPIFYTRRRKEYYDDLIKKVKAKLHSWKGKLLSFGGKETLISSVLQSMPVHMLSILDPPKNILVHLHKLFARFFWSTKEEGRSRHWSSWQNLCLPKEEGGLGFRSLNDVSKALFAKLWWKFRTTKSLWSNFMWNKYCKKELPTVVQFRRGSHVWKQMINAREEVEHEILWELKSGTKNIWHENWTGLGALYHVLPEEFPINEELQDVAELRLEGTWNEDLLEQNFTEEIVDHVRSNIHYEGNEEHWDKPYRMPTASGKFSVTSAWQIIRHRSDPNQEFKHMWIKGLPFKISFFLWRLWKGRIPTDDVWRRQGQMVMSRCWCCQQPQEETIQHIFLTSATASKVWNLFMGAAAITVPLVQLKQVIRHWWNAQCCPKLKPLFQAVPTIITWELWKKRNAGKYGGSVTTHRVIHEVNRTLHYLANVRYAWLPNIPLLWPDMIQYFEGYKPVIITRRITWQLPFQGWYKCNTDGASRGNPGPSSLGFCVRNDEGDLIYARAVDLGETTNVVAEARAIVQGLEYCVEHNLHPLILETDSLVMKKVIEKEWDTPWTISQEVRRIKEIMDNFNVIIQHVFREGNVVADFIANIVFSFAGTSEFHSFSELPSAGRSVLLGYMSVVLAWLHAHSEGTLIVHKSCRRSRLWMVQHYIEMRSPNMKELPERMLVRFWRLVLHFPVVSAWFHAHYGSVMARFRRSQASIVLAVVVSLCLLWLGKANDQHRLRDQVAMVSHEHIAHKKEAESAHWFLHLSHSSLLSFICLVIICVLGCHISVVLVCLHTHSGDDNVVYMIILMRKQMENTCWNETHWNYMINGEILLNSIDWCSCLESIFAFGMHTLAPGESIRGAACYLPLAIGFTYTDRRLKHSAIHFAKSMVDHARWQALREALEGARDQNSNISAEIEIARAVETKARKLSFPEEDSENLSKSGGGEDSEGKDASSNKGQAA